jgi:SAM-dependent methyltransferase
VRLDQIAAQAWNRITPIEQTSDAIHDGARTTEELAARANWYVRDLLFGRFPQAIPGSDAVILEIGSGLGWIMQAMNDYLAAAAKPPRSITGLDIAPNMITQATSRLGARPPFGFLLYDGIHIPVADASFDLIYSVAAMQHIPRPSVFNLFFEIKRLLKIDGFAVFHLLSTAHLHEQEKQLPWRTEIQNQLSGACVHWHHFYAKQELTDVLRITGFPYVAVLPYRESLFCCVSNGNARSLPAHLSTYLPGRARAALRAIKSMLARVASSR